jgi:hypothetical protein
MPSLLSDSLLDWPRLCDPEAQALYLNNGFEIVKTDNWFAPVLGVDRRHLMKKDLL